MNSHYREALNLLDHPTLGKASLAKIEYPSWGLFMQHSSNDGAEQRSKRSNTASSPAPFFPEVDIMTLEPHQVEALDADIKGSEETNGDSAGREYVLWRQRLVLHAWNGAAEELRNGKYTDLYEFFF